MSEVILNMHCPRLLKLEVRGRKLKGKGTHREGRDDLFDNKKGVVQDRGLSVSIHSNW